MAGISGREAWQRRSRELTESSESPESSKSSESFERNGLYRTFKISRRSVKKDAGRYPVQELITESGKVRRAQKGLFVHYCDICKRGPYSRREHINRHKRGHYVSKSKCVVCGKILKQDEFLQHMQNSHPDIVDLPVNKCQSSCTDGRPLEKTVFTTRLGGSTGASANPKWPYDTGQLVSVGSTLTCQSSSTSILNFSCSKSQGPLVLSSEEDTTTDESLTPITDTLCRSGTIEPAQTSLGCIRSSNQDNTRSNEGSTNLQHEPPYFSSRPVPRQGSLHWPFSRCLDPAPAMLRNLVCEFSFVYGKEWMGELFRIKSRQNGIDQSLFAVTAMWQSKMKKDSPLRQKALSVYQGAILNVRGQLDSSRLNDQFVLVAMSMIFAAIEAQVDDGANQTGWITHIKGALAVLNTTSPQMWSSETHIRLYIDLRYMSLLMFLGSRRPCFLAKKEWKDLIWPKASKTVRESLIDELVDLPELLYICSTLMKRLETKSTSVCDADISKGQHLLHEFRRFETRLNLWFQGIEEHNNSPLYWRKSSLDPMPLSSADELPLAIWFTNSLIAETLTLYWAGLLLIYLPAIQISSCLRVHVLNETYKSEVPGQKLPAISTDLDACDTVRWPPEAPDARKLATKLGQSIEYMKSDAFQPLNGARLACAPLWPAIRFFIRYPGPELNWLRRSAELLSERTGLLYVSKIATNPVDIFEQNSE